MKTVRVRIAVAVDPNGSWNASAWSNGTVTDFTAEVGEITYWVEADLPIPQTEPAVVEGQVSPA